MRLMLTGGGTGGHIYPGLTLLHYMEKMYGSVEVLYVGSERGLEQDIVKRTGIPFVSIPAAGLRRQLSLSGLKTAWTTAQGYWKAKKLVRQFRPDVVVGTGGYVTLPVVFAAAAYNVPSVVWEGNARPGLTNQLCARKAYGVAVCFEDTKKWFPKANKVVVTGNPRASEVLEVGEAELAAARTQYRLSPGKKLIVCFAGSRGAETVNEVWAKTIPRFAEKPDWQLLYVTGDKHYEAVQRSLADVPPNVTVIPFVHDMPAVLPQADALVTRAGSSTLAEICSFGLASILIPSPYVTANHQEENARRLVDKGAALMIRESELTPESLWKALLAVLETNQGDALRRAAKQLATPNAVRDLAALVMEAWESRRSS